MVRPRAGGPIAFAGLWESWMGLNGEEMETAAIITSEANSDVAHIHHRMPVIIPQEAFDLWLDPNVDTATATALIAPAQLAASGPLLTTLCRSGYCWRLRLPLRMWLLITGPTRSIS